MMKFAVMALLALTSKQPVGGSQQPPVDDQTPPKVHLEPLKQLPAISEDQYPTDQFMLAISGNIAAKIYWRHSPPRDQQIKQTLPWNLSTHVTTDPGLEGLKCVRRVAKYGPEQYRCNIAFHPSQPGGDQIVVPSHDGVPYTYTLIPAFEKNSLSMVTLRVAGDDYVGKANVIQDQCWHLSRNAISGSNVPCAYTVEYDDVNDMYFPDDIYPQGVAVGWGVVPDPSTDTPN